MTASNEIPPARRARRAADAISRCHESTSAAVMTATQRRPGGPKRILLVDDDAGVRGSLSDVLVSEEYVVIPANDGQQAIELAGTVPFDLVILDLNMPRKNGWDTFEELTRRHPLLPVVIVTARPNQLFTAVGAGAGALLEKPLDIPTLLRTIKWLLAEPVATRLARLAGRETDFHYSAARD
ncbi:MAG TPA: response regulator [Verrucomicrobiae bacterium]|nr:response regulator [Verrucomicrobiae bacterium]